MKKVLYVIVFAILVLAGVTTYFVVFSKKTTEQLPTYFTYTQDETATVEGLTSTQAITSDDLYQYDQVAFDLVAKNTSRSDFTTEVSKIYAYLAVAERDFSDLSYNTSGSFAGSVGPVSKDVLCLFFTADCDTIVVQGENDAYSQAIEKLVMAKITARIKKDEAGLTSYPIKVGKEYWNGPQPSIGIQNGSSLGWFITSGSEFRAPPPPAFDSKEFADQVHMTVEALAKATPEEKRATVFWAGGPGTKTPPGQLLALGDEYMQVHAVPLQKVLLVRSVLTMAVADAVTAVFDSKYTYWVKRPFMVEHSIITIMPTPNHPSYPAGHSTLSAAGAVVLEHYFPADTSMWEAKAHEAGMSRIWGGIHYVMDHEAGVVIGKKVGTAAIEAPSSAE